MGLKESKVAQAVIKTTEFVRFTVHLRLVWGKSRTSECEGNDREIQTLTNKHKAILERSDGKSLSRGEGRERLANSPVDFCSEQHEVRDIRERVT